LQGGGGGDVEEATTEDGGRGGEAFWWPGGRLVVDGTVWARHSTSLTINRAVIDPVKEEGMIPKT